MEVFQFEENKTTLTNNNTKTHKHKKEAKKTILPKMKMCKAIAMQKF
jgi:hypothetical protein